MDKWLNQVIEGDCLEVMREIPDKSVDMILCDLPYGTTACKWDSVIPFEDLWREYKRLIKLNGAIVLTACQPFTSLLICSNLDWFKYCWIWEKPQGVDPFMANIRPLNNYEDICVFSEGTTKYNPIKQQGTPYQITRDKTPRKLEVTNTVMRTTTTENFGERYPTRILRFNQERGEHPTQKPTDLFSYLIETYTLPGEIVLDNCLGSGTTAVAALNTGRFFIGIEKESKYCEIAQQRVAQAQMQGSLFAELR